MNCASIERTAECGKFQPQLERMMTTFKKTLLATAVALSAGSVFAFPVFEPGTNTLNFQAYENQYRTDANCAAFGGCLAFNAANDPVGFKRVDPATTGATGVIVGDIYAGALYVTGVHPGDFPNNVPSAAMEFTGYFAQEVGSIDVIAGTNVKLNFKAVTVDPFGKLGAGEMFKLYTDISPDFNPAAAGTTFSQIAAATDGGAGATFWGTLGLGAEGYAYTLDNLAVAGNDTNFAAKNYLALDVLTKGASYNAGDLNKVNDDSESLVGGVTAGGGLLCSAADIANPLVACTDLAGNADIKKNGFFPAGAPFFFNANDPLALNRIPEPGSLALLGLGLAGLGFMRRRRSA